MWILEREGIPLLIASDLVLRLCLNDYINECKATGQRISPHFIAEEMAEFGPQQQQLATREGKLLPFRIIMSGNISASICNRSMISFCRRIKAHSS